jgi:arylsulfatase A-like enzyme
MLAAVAAALLVAACAGTPSSSSSAPAKPRLVVFLVVDGLPQRQVVDYRDQLAPDGLRRFLDRGAWFSDAHYGQAITQTAPGHATMLTGAYPHRTGIIANEWRNPATGETEYCTGDTSSTYIGHKTNKLDGTSPRNLRAETVGDVLKRMDPRSKVIAISGKDRGAILPAGKTGIPYMYQSDTGLFASATFYMKEHPRWVEDFNAKKPADAYFGQEWKPLLAGDAYARSLPDEQPWYMKGGKLPMKMGEGSQKPDRAFYGSLLRSPYADELSLAFARAAIAGEDLGRDDSPDILAISLSGHDYVNHAFSAESRLSHDHLLRLDRMFQDLFRDLDATVGRDNYVAVLTADHGFMPAPQHSKSLGRDAGIVNTREMMSRLNAELAMRFGDGQWALGISAQGVVLNNKLVASKGVARADVENEARRILMQEAGIAAVTTRTELERGLKPGDPFAAALTRTWHPELSADLQVTLKPYWMMASSSGYASTHGSPYPYDSNVPILFYGPAWVKPGRIDSRVEVVDIAPTLARMLGVPAPSSAEGKPLPLERSGR